MNIMFSGTGNVDGFYQLIYYYKQGAVFKRPFLFSIFYAEVCVI